MGVLFYIVCVVGGVFGMFEVVIFDFLFWNVLFFGFVIVILLCLLIGMVMFVYD